MITHFVVFCGERFSIHARFAKYRWFVGCIMDGNPIKVGWHAERLVAEAEMRKFRKLWTETTGWTILPVQVEEKS